MNINIIGAGKLGKTLGRLIVEKNLGKICAVLTSQLESAKEALAFIGAGMATNTIDTLPQADIYIITTPDDLIRTVCEKICNCNSPKPGSIFIHCSGMVTSDALSTARRLGCYAVSIHPMRSFANPALSVGNYEGTYCAMEGDSGALSTVTHLFTAMGSIVYKINKEKKSLYHAAGVFASNYVITLFGKAIQCLREAGVEEPQAFDIAINLMKGTLNNIEHVKNPQEALTGPIKRGDLATIKSHIEALSEELRDVYSVLGMATIGLTSHEDMLKRALVEELRGK